MEGLQDDFRRIARTPDFVRQISWLGATEAKSNRIRPSIADGDVHSVVIWQGWQAERGLVRWNVKEGILLTLLWHTQCKGRIRRRAVSGILGTHCVYTPCTDWSRETVY